MEVRSRSASKENLQPFCTKLSCSASDCSDTTKDQFAHHHANAPNHGGSGLSSPASDASRISIDDLTPHLRCGLCREHVAGAHVLSCSHIFCGGCLADHLIATPACPACQMALRSIPVRCVAIDHVVSALLPALTPAQREAFKRRKERGESAPSIIAKMLWWLEAGAPAPGGAGDPTAASRQTPSVANNMLLQHSQAVAGGRGVGLPSSSGAMHHHHQMTAAGLAGTLAGVPGPSAHEAAMAAAMTAAAAAAAASSAASHAPAYNLSSQLGVMSLGGLGGMGGGVPGLGAHNAGFAGLGGLRDPHHAPMLPDPAVAAYQAALQSAVALQSMGGGYPQLGLMGM